MNDNHPFNYPDLTNLSNELNSQPFVENFTTKDSGERQNFSTGSRRDTEKGKPRYDLISNFALKRLAELLARGAEKYGERNWEEGQPLSRYYSSMFRHMMQWYEGDTSEDHLAAIMFNAMAILHTEVLILTGELPQELADAGYLARKKAKNG